MTEEKLVATIQFDDIPDQKDTYLAYLYDFEGDKIDDFTIYGDQWRIDVGFTKVDCYVNLLGIDSVYALNRLDGRYKNIKEQNIRKKVSYQLESHNLVDVFSWFVDTEYGSSTYQKIKLNTKYTVLHSPTGLLVRQQHVSQTKKKSYFEKAKE